MEHLINDLKAKLILRRKKENDKALKYDPLTDKDLLMLSAGKISELDQLISYLENMVNYNNQTKKITK